MALLSGGVAAGAVAKLTPVPRKRLPPAGAPGGGVADFAMIWSTRVLMISPRVSRSDLGVDVGGVPALVVGLPVAGVDVVGPSVGGARGDVGTGVPPVAPSRIAMRSIFNLKRDGRSAGFFEII